MTNKEKFLTLVSDDDDKTLAWIKTYRANKPFRRKAQKIAYLILMRLDALGWSQKDLVEKMEVSPQLVNQWVKGKANDFSLKQLLCIGDCFGIDLFEIPLP